MKGINVGIVGTGIYIPNNYMTAKDIADATMGKWSEDAVRNKLGINKKPVPSDNPSDGTQEMAVLATLDCIENTGVDPKEIDLILCFGEEWKEYPLTTSALYIQDKIEAINAWGIDLQNRCCSSVSAMKIAKDMMLADEDLNTVLIAGGYRNGDFIDYTDSNMSMMFDLSAGAGAILLKKNYNKNILLGSHIISDASLARTAGLEIGGIINPFNSDNIDKGMKSLRLLDVERMKKRLDDVSLENFNLCIERALEKSELSKEDLGYFAILHVKRQAHLDILSHWGLNEEQSIYLQDYGHMGQVDQILSLHLALEQGKIKDGSVVCMLAAGIGYVWAANIIRWGNC